MRLRVIRPPEGDLYSLTVKAVHCEWVVLTRDHSTGEATITIMGGTLADKEKLEKEGIITELIMEERP